MSEKFDLKQEVKALEENTKLGNDVSSQLNKLAHGGHLDEVKTQFLADVPKASWTDDHIVFESNGAGSKIYKKDHGWFNEKNEWVEDHDTENKIAIDTLMNSGKSIQDIMKSNGYAALPEALGKITGKPSESIADGDKHK